MSERGDRKHFARLRFLAAAIVALAVPSAGPVLAQSISIDDNDIGGVVTGASGPEAGVWVIAETTELPTRFARMVVTDDQGRYVIPDLPDADYQIWVRGYGLVDSPKMRGKPGELMNLTAVKAPDDASAAHYYPAIYWYSMVHIPAATEFGTNPDLEGKDSGRLSQTGEEHRLRWLSSARSGGHAHYPRRVRRVRHGRRRLDPPHPVRAGRCEHGQPDGQLEQRAAQILRRMDRRHRRRRSAAKASTA